MSERVKSLESFWKVKALVQKLVLNVNFDNLKVLDKVSGIEEFKLNVDALILSTRKMLEEELDGLATLVSGKRWEWDGKHDKSGLRKIGYILNSS